MPPKLVVQGVAIRAAHRPHLLPSGCWTARSGSSWHCWQGRHVGWCRGTPGYLIHPELDNIHHHIHIYLRSGGQDLSGRQPARLLREVEWPQSSPDCNSLDYLMWGGGIYGDHQQIPQQHFPWRRLSSTDSRPCRARIWRAPAPASGSGSSASSRLSVISSSEWPR